MNPENQSIEKALIGSKTVHHLARQWMGWAVLFFLVSAVFGLMMRYFFIGEIPYFQFKNLLHAHSHVALLGWGFLLVAGLLVFFFVKDQKRIKIYLNLLLLNVVAVIGMALTFPVEGYGLFSIGFSTLQLFVGYGFAFYFLQDLKKTEKSNATSLITFSIYWMVLSSIGLWAIGPIGATLGRLHPLYFMSVQWFLHLQLNGWFVYVLLGLLVHFLGEKGFKINIPKTFEYLLHISLFLTYALSVSWSTPMKGLLGINGIGVIFQAIAYFFILKPIVFVLISEFELVKDWATKLVWLGIISLGLKAFLQCLLVFPEVAQISYTIRMFVIGFIHLIMLGAITFSLGGIALKNNWLPRDASSGWGWSFLALGFLLSEMLLLGQGTLLWLKLGFIPSYHFLIFLASTLFPIGLSIILYRIPKKSSQNFEHQNDNSTKINNPTNKKPMKISMLVTIGVSVLLLTSCGGGSENQSTSKAPSAEKVEADPRGIGEIKKVELKEAIDETMASNGKAIVDMKCTACHQLNDKRLVGPGFQGVTNRRSPEWIMNMITNVEVMLDEDPVAQALLEECLTRMPNQNISISESYEILEFLRKNDEEKAGARDGAAI
ncbi:c-type cytochrome [Rhodonellum sp.]|uniref:c-type cytochrome n=1 Tax=Rhodonellum sp. TaxID=2231180 RepID=UPI00272766B3|nr:c-type cytochrome [Rhodonellum sp.]MDO9554463.1 cytochrome c [Rhodonellum sp.]